ncbi:glutathione S-transferase domain protein [Gorgonomyces haynaldii]|nr:glutathione S-transferase domain protein [Gorgonomyces haynaldii]
MSKPTYPETYVLPKVWTAPKEGQGLNEPTAGARFEKELQRGKHHIQLYSLATPNGQKVTILLEELGIEYDAWKIDISKGDQFGSGFVQVNPNSKIPALFDYSDPEPVRVFESVSILLYLAEKYQKFLPKKPAQKAEAINWAIWQVGTAPYLGSGGFSHFFRSAPIHFEYAINRYATEVKRILDVLDKQLEGRAYVIGDEYTIADIALYPWIKGYVTNDDVKTFLQTDQYKNIVRWVGTIGARPAVQRGVRVNGFGPDAVENRHSASDFN